MGSPLPSKRKRKQILKLAFEVQNKKTLGLKLWRVLRQLVSMIVTQLSFKKPAQSRLRVVPLLLSPSCVTQKKTMEKNGCMKPFSPPGFHVAIFYCDFLLCHHIVEWTCAQSESRDGSVQHRRLCCCLTLWSLPSFTTIPLYLIWCHTWKTKQKSDYS